MSLVDDFKNLEYDNDVCVVRYTVYNSQLPFITSSALKVHIAFEKTYRAAFTSTFEAADVTAYKAVEESDGREQSNVVMRVSSPLTATAVLVLVVSGEQGNQQERFGEEHSPEVPACYEAR